jgi:hypothetical protein
MNYLKLFVVLIIIIYHETGYSQLQMGIAHDNVNVTEGIRINPALAVDPMPWLDISVAGMYIFGASNGAYVAAEEFSPFTGKLPSQLSQDLNIEKVDGQIEAMIIGPAINASIGKFSIGVSSALRNYAVGQNIQKEFARGLIYGLNIPEYYNTPLNGSNYRAKAMSFLEFGVNGGMIAYQKGKIIVNAGINLKYMLGLGGINLLVDDFNYEMQDSTNAYVNDFSGKYGGSDIGFHPGVGYGADIGFTLEKKVAPGRYYSPHSPKSGCKHLDYVYRLGFSVLDIGAIKFKGSYYREVQNANGEWNDYADARTNDIGAIINNLDNVLESGVTNSKSSYFAKLPLSFSLQFDYNFGKGIYVNSTLLYGVALKNSFGAERISMLAITPRFEGKRFGISAPLSINTIWKPGLGLAFRFWFLSIGTDNIFPYFLNMDVYRLDFYAHLKVPIFINKPCKKRGLGEYDWHFSDCSAPGARTPRKRR